MVYIYTGFSLLGRWGESPYPATNLLIPPSSPPNFYSLPPKDNSTQQKNKKVIFSCSHCSCTIFVWISYSFDTQTMLILILIDVQYSQNAVFSFGKFSNRQNHSSSDTHQIPQQCSLLFDTKSGKLLKF